MSERLAPVEDAARYHENCAAATGSEGTWYNRGTFGKELLRLWKSLLLPGETPSPASQEAQTHQKVSPRKLPLVLFSAIANSATDRLAAVPRGRVCIVALAGSAPGFC